MEELNIMQRLAVWALPVLFAITVHEVAHGWVAQRFGDPTARMLGRLTLNPIKHIDPVGTLLVPALLLYFGGFLFGWAKPVPVTWENLKNPKRDMALVALAGPTANLLMAIFWAVVMKLGLVLGGQLDWLARPLVYMGSAGISINVMLMVLNLLPLPPLDGGRVMSGLLPDRAAYTFNRIEPYGFFILLGLLATGVLGSIMLPVVNMVQGALFFIMGL
ncbi:MAG: site-2 protease family protein [Gammaproteobacteria bacterium]|nr:site-2 protease family protein [Gammaproteobacteria bacterium]